MGPRHRLEKGSRPFPKKRATNLGKLKGEEPWGHPGGLGPKRGLRRRRGHHLVKD